MPDNRVAFYKLPYPPTVNTYWRRVGARTLISKRGREYRRDVVSTMAGYSGVMPAVGPLVVRITVYPPDKRRRDLDNILKALLDALQAGGVYADDSQIVRLEVERFAPHRGGYVIVDISEREPTDA